MSQYNENEINPEKQITEVGEFTPQMRSRNASEVTNSNFDLINRKLLDLNDGSPKADCIQEDEYEIKYDVKIDNVVKNIKEQEYEETILQRDIKFIQRVAFYFQFFSEFILRDFKNKPLNNIISVSTIVLLIIFLGLINSMMSLSPMIYLMMSEQEVGENDILFINSSLTKYYSENFNLQSLFLDYKSINDLYCTTFLKGCTSRFHIKGMQIINNQEIFSDVFLIDVMKEEEIGFGRRIQLSELKDNECYISRNLYVNIKKSGENSTNKKTRIVLDFTMALVLNSIPVLQSEELNKSFEFKRNFIANLINRKFKEDGVRYRSFQDIIYHYLPNNLLNSEQKKYVDTFDFDQYLGFNSSSQDDLTEEQRQIQICQRIAEFSLSIQISFHLEVKDFIENSVGKYEDKYSNFNWMLDQIASSIVNHLLGRMEQYSYTYYMLLYIKQEEMTQFLKVNLNNHANEQFFEDNAIAIYGMYDNKQNVYLEDTKIIEQFKLKSNQFTDTFGLSHSVSLLFPLSITQIQNLKQKQILDNSYNCGVILLIALSSVIIYSVSQSTIQQKVQEYGVIRIIGYSTRSLVLFSFAKAVIFYMIPALALAELLNFIILYFIKAYFYDLLKFSSDLSQDYSSTYYATTVILGVCLPLFCNLYPFKEFFDKQVLSQSLNVHQRVLQQTKIIVQKLEKYGISFYALINSIILVVVGILTYYFAPYAFVSKKIGLFLFIVNLTFLMVNIEKDRNCLDKNMFACFIQKRLKFGDIHPQQFQKQQFKNEKIRNDNNDDILILYQYWEQCKQLNNDGSDYLLEVDKNNIALDEDILTKNLEKFKKKHPDVIKAYSFVSKSIKNMEGFKKGAKIKNFIGQTQTFDIYAISPDFFDSIYSELFIPESPKFEDQNPSNSLYFNNGTSIGEHNKVGCPFFIKFLMKPIKIVNQSKIQKKQILHFISEFWSQILTYLYKLLRKTTFIK